MLCQAAAAAAVERCPEQWPLGTLITDPSKAASGPGQACVDTAWDNYQPAPSRGLFDGLHTPDLIKADHGSTCVGAGARAARVAGGCDMFVVMKGAAMMVGPISQVCDDWLQRALCPAPPPLPTSLRGHHHHPPAGVRHIWRRRPTTAFSLMKAPSSTFKLYLSVL